MSNLPIQLIITSTNHNYCIVLASMAVAWPEMPGHGASILMFLINAHHARALLIITLILWQVYGGETLLTNNVNIRLSTYSICSDSDN